MGRELRQVAKDWEHPKDENGDHIPLFANREQGGYVPPEIDSPDYAATLDEARFIEETEGPEAAAEFKDYWLHGDRSSDYMPEWDDEEKTHFQMYENTTEGTPVSPVMESKEELAQWLADNSVSAGLGEPASYETWMEVCEKGHSISAVIIPGQGAVSGAEAKNALDQAVSEVLQDIEKNKNDETPEQEMSQDEEQER